MVAYHTGSDPIEIGDFGSKINVKMTQYSFYLHNSLLTSLLCISAYLCLIEMKFDMSLRYILGWFVSKSYKNRMGDDVIVTSIKFSPNNCPYLKFYWTYWLQTSYLESIHNKITSMIKMKVTLTGDEDHRQRPKVTKMNLWSHLANWYTNRHHTWYQGTIQ